MPLSEHLEHEQLSPWDVQCSKCRQYKHYQDGYAYIKGKRHNVCLDCQGKQVSRSPKKQETQSSFTTQMSSGRSEKRHSGYKNPKFRHQDMITLICDLMTGEINMENITPLHYYGSKGGQLDWILPKLEWNVRHTFVDVFGGMGHILLNRHPAAYEILNDRDSLVVNLHRCVRNWPEELYRRSIIKSWARDEFLAAVTHIKQWRALPEEERCRLLEPVGAPPKDEHVDLAITDANLYATVMLCAEQFMTYLRQGYMSKTGSNSWEPHYELSSGKSDEAHRMLKLFDVSKRLSRVQIENIDAFELIGKCNYPNNLLYCDPPYVPSSRRKASDYYYEMSEQDHVRLCEMLLDHQGRVMVSGYHNEIYDEGYFTKKNGWYSFERDVIFTGGNYADNVDRERTEVLWVNWNPQLAGRPGEQNYVLGV